MNALYLARIYCVATSSHVKVLVTACRDGGLAAERGDARREALLSQGATDERDWVIGGIELICNTPNRTTVEI